MPASPRYMKKRGEEVDKAIGRRPLTKEEKEALKKEKDQGKQKMGPWVLGLLMFVVLGSSFLQIITNIQTSPSMSEEH